MDGFHALIALGHLNKAETAGTTGELIGDDFHRVHRSIGFEQRSQLGLCGFEREVADIDVHAHSINPFWVSAHGISGERGRGSRELSVFGDLQEV